MLFNWLFFFFLNCFCHLGFLLSSLLNLTFQNVFFWEYFLLLWLLWLLWLLLLLWLLWLYLFFFNLLFSQNLIISYAIYTFSCVYWINSEIFWLSSSFFLRYYDFSSANYVLIYQSWLRQRCHSWSDSSSSSPFPLLLHIFESWYWRLIFASSSSSSSGSHCGMVLVMLRSQGSINFCFIVKSGFTLRSSRSLNVKSLRFLIKRFIWIKISSIT